MAGSWNFTIDSEIQKELSVSLNTSADNFDLKVKAMYEQIDSMGSNSYWVGEDYDAFQTGTHGYEKALSDLSDGMRMFSKHFEIMSTGTDGLSSELITIVNNITGTNSGGTGSTGSTSGGTGGTGFNGGSSEAINGGNSGDDINNENGTHQSASGATHGGGSRRKDEESAEESGISDEPVVSTEEVIEKNSNPSGGIYNNGTIKGSETTSEYSGELVTYKSGDSVNINGQNYNVYGGFEKANGEVVMMYGDNKGNLYYQNESGQLENVTYTYTQYENGGRQFATRTVNATVNDLGTSINNGVGKLPITLNVGDQKISSLDQVATTITCPNVGGSPVLNGINNGTYIDNQVGITTDGTLKTSYYGQIDGTSVNGSTIITATAMRDFSDYTRTQGGDITLKIPQGQYVQWDSPAGGTGYVFSTDNSPVYLRWDSSAAGGNGAYHIVDEFGNVSDNRDFTLDGFNDNGGINGGVWK